MYGNQLLCLNDDNFQHSSNFSEKNKKINVEFRRL